MSRYLVERIHGLANVEVVTGAAVSGLEGEGGVLQAVRWRLGATLREVTRPVSHLFLFIGAEPNTDWLTGSGIALDAKGFVLTGLEAGAGLNGGWGGTAWGSRSVSPACVAPPHFRHPVVVGQRNSARHVRDFFHL
jgi:alkyl hydroperoxide reductase subunit AhpF